MDLIVVNTKQFCKVSFRCSGVQQEAQLVIPDGRSCAALLGAAL